MRAFFDKAAQDRIGTAVVRCETLTAAEVVVAVRRQAGRGRWGANFGLGAVTALAALLALLYLPTPFPLWTFPVDTAIAFLGGSLLGLLWPGWSRFWGRSELRPSAEQAAKASFYDLGVSRTRARTGILVFLAAFERELVLLPDVGIEEDLDPLLSEVEAVLKAAFVSGDVEAFASRLEALGGDLSEALPRAADDVNELPDEMVVAS